MRGAIGADLAPSRRGPHAEPFSGAAAKPPSAMAGLLEHLLPAALLLVAAIARPCFASLVYGLGALWLLTNRTLAQVFVVSCAVIATTALIAGVGVQIAETVRGEVSTTATAVLSNAIGYTVGANWSSIAQPLADVFAIGAMVVFSVARGTSAADPHVRPEPGAGTGLAMACWATMLAASIFERTMLHLPYFVLALASLQSWALRRRRSGTMLLSPGVRAAVLLYTLLHMVADYLMQVPLLRDAPFASSAVATGVGLTPLPIGSAQLWLSAGLRLLLFTVYGSVHWGIWPAAAEAVVAGGRSSSDLTSPLLPRQGSSDGSGSLTPRPLMKQSTPGAKIGGGAGTDDDDDDGSDNDEITAALSILSTAILSLCKIVLTVSTLGWALGVHCVLSLPLLLSVFVMSKMGSRRAFATAGYVLLYGTLFLTAQYVYDAIHVLIEGNSETDRILLNIGLRTFDQYGARLGLQCAAALPLAIAARVGRVDISSGVLLKVSALMRRVCGLFVGGGSTDYPGHASAQDRSPIQEVTLHPTDSSADAPSHPVASETEGCCMWCVRAVRLTWLLIISLLRFLVMHLDAVALLTLYTAGLSRIDLIHSGYVAFCLLFVLFPALTRRGWVYLLVYCEIALAAFYVWQFSWIGEGASDTPGQNASSFTGLLGLQYNATCTEVMDPESVFGNTFLFKCWDYVGLPAFAAVVASVQFSIFRGTLLIRSSVEASNRDRRGSVEAGTNRLFGSSTSHLSSVAEMESKLWRLAAAFCAKFGHYTSALVLILVASVGPSTGLRTFVLLVANLIFVAIQTGKSRNFGKGTSLLLHVTMAYLYVTILVKYVYKFPQIQKIVDEQSGVRIEREALEDIGLIGGNVYIDLLPDTIGMALIGIIIKHRQTWLSWDNEQAPPDEPATGSSRIGKVLWQWAMEQSTFGDLLAASLMFGVGCYRLSAVHYLYFLIGLFSCCFGRLPGLLWTATFLIAILHMMALYVLQFQSLQFDQYNCSEESNWHCCAVWFGSRERFPGDPAVSFTWDLFLPLIAIASLDIHRRFHTALAEADLTEDLSDTITGSFSRQGSSNSSNSPRASASAGSVSSSPSKSVAESSSRTMRVAMWLRDHATLSIVGLNFCYLMLMVGTIVDANIMSIIYTLLIFVCVVNNDGNSPTIWIGFSTVFGLLLAARYVVYLGVPPCLTNYRLPFRNLPAEWRTWLGVANPCVTDNVTFEGCAVYDFAWDCAVLFLVTAFARVCGKNQLRQKVQIQIVGYGKDWPSHLYLMMWDVGLVNGLTIILIFISYWHYNLLTLGYASLGIVLLHERNKLTEDTPAITLLMAYAGLVLLLLAAFQCPVFKEGPGVCTDLVSGSDITELASNSTSCLCPGCENTWQLDETSFQSILGLHKYSERTSDLWITAVAFLIAMGLRGTVQSQIYKTHIIPMAVQEYDIDAKARHLKHLEDQAKNLLALDEREANERVEREQARKRLHQEHSLQARRTERSRTMTMMPKVAEGGVEPELEPEPEPEPELEESVEVKEEEDEDEDTEVNQMSRLHKLFTAIVEWLHMLADPLIHDKPVLSEDDASALVSTDDKADEEMPAPASPQSHGRGRPRTQVLMRYVMRMHSHVLRVAKVGMAHSLVLCQAKWYAMYNHSLQLCCAAMAMGFVAHRDIISCILFVTLFGYCLLSSKSITVGYWRVALRLIELRIVLVKFLTAWPTECVFSTTTCTGGWPGDGPGLDVRSHQRIIDTENGSWVWDLALLLSLLLHRQRLRRRGEWTKKGDSATNQERIDEISDILAGSAEIPASGARDSSGSDTARGPELGVSDGRASNMEWASRIGTDTYVPMFLAQGLVFCISPFLYADLFGEELEAISEQLTTSSLRWQLILLVFGIFMLIVFDLMVYLCKSLRAKLILQWVSCLTFVVFFFWWTIALDRGSSSGDLTGTRSGKPTISTAQWLMAGAFSVYFYQSAVQVAAGYPRFQGISTVRRWYTHSTKGLRPSLLSAQRAVPFLTELIYIVEWLCTDTTLSLYDYIRVEEIYILLFQGKVFIDKQAEAGAKKHGETQPFYPAKLTYGVGGLVALVGVLWAPLFLFSTANPFSTQRNDVIDVSISFDLRTTDNANAALTEEQRTSTYTLFLATSASLQAAPSDEQLEQYDPFFRTQIADVLGDSERDKIQRVSVDRDAAVGWQINLPARLRLESSLMANSTGAAVRLRCVFTRQDSALQPQILYSTAWSGLTTNETDVLYKMIGNDTYLDSVLPLPSTVYPLYLRLPEQGAAIPLGTQQTSVLLGHNVSVFPRVVLGESVTTLYESWSLFANRTRDEDANGDGRSDNGLLFVLINDKIATGLVTSALSMGAVVFYGTVVIAVGRVMRGFVAEIVKDAIYRDPDKVTELMALCEDMFAARFLREFGVEEDLHDELRDVFRNFERLYRYTTR
jgi:hypothetical protein